MLWSTIRILTYDLTYHQQNCFQYNPHRIIRLPNTLDVFLIMLNNPTTTTLYLQASITVFCFWWHEFFPTTSVSTNFLNLIQPTLILSGDTIPFHPYCVDKQYRRCCNIYDYQTWVDCSSGGLQTFHYESDSTLIYKCWLSQEFLRHIS